MIAAFKGDQYALGIATNVYSNSEEEKELISEELNIYANWEEVWELSTVKSLFNNNENAFLKHWEDHYKWIMWKTPIDHYHWFEKPIKLKPERISGKKRLSLMHGSFQWIAPETVIEIIHKNIPQNKRIILDWLASGEFDETVLRRKPKLSAKTRRFKNRYGTRNGNSPPDQKYEYWVEGNRSGEPLHARLQARFVKYLQNKGINPEENINYVDVQYQLGNELIFAEIKPTDNIETRYALRAGIGQLFEYRYRHNKDAKLEIVIGNEPTDEEKSFIRSLGMILTYYSDKDKNFKSEY